MITPFMLRTGADVREIVLEFSARTFPAWEVTVNETAGNSVWEVRDTLQSAGGFLQEIKGYSENSKR